jgi:hypothetical protein
MNWFFWVKVFRLFRTGKNFFGVQTVDKVVVRCTTSYLFIGSAQRVCDALFGSVLVGNLMSQQ